MVAPPATEDAATKPTLGRYEIIKELLTAEPEEAKAVWTCKQCGGTIRWREFIPCPRGTG